ncbi:MAG: glycosyltransferase family 2 protein, partial [Cyclobacteriaceae bacterium]
DFRYYILLNSDVQVTPGWDQEMVKFMTDHPGTAASQPKVRSLSMDGYFDYAGAGGGFLDHLGYPYCRGRILHTLEKDLGQYDDQREIDWASGACFCTDAGLFHEFGGFNPHFFAHMEEIDLCWRYRNKGFPIRFNGRVTVFHLGGGTLSQTNPFKTYLNFRNSLLMLESNLTFPDLMKTLWKRLFLDFGALVHIAFTKGFAHSRAIIKAYWHYLRDRKKAIKSNTGNKNIPSTGPQKVYSIIWVYYLKGKRKFSDLT